MDQRVLQVMKLSRYFENKKVGAIPSVLENTISFTYFSIPNTLITCKRMVAHARSTNEVKFYFLSYDWLSNH